MICPYCQEKRNRDEDERQGIRNNGLGLVGEKRVVRTKADGVFREKGEKVQRCVTLRKVRG